METFWKAAAVILITVLLEATIEKTEKDIAIVLTAAACCAVLMGTFHYLSEITAFLWEMDSLFTCQNSFMELLLKIAGTALTAEVTGLICSDAGNQSLGKVVQVLGNAAILFLALPIFETFLTMIQDILGMI